MNDTRAMTFQDCRDERKDVYLKLIKTEERMGEVEKKQSAHDEIMKNLNQTLKDLGKSLNSKLDWRYFALIVTIACVVIGTMFKMILTISSAQSDLRSQVNLIPSEVVDTIEEKFNIK